MGHSSGKIDCDSLAPRKFIDKFSESKNRIGCNKNQLKQLVGLLIAFSLGTILPARNGN